MKNYLKKDGTLEKKAIELITNLRSGNYKKLSYFYSSRTTFYPMVLNSDLFDITSDKEVIVKEGFSPLTKAIVRINKENKYVEQTLKELEIKDIEEENAKKQAEERFKKMVSEAKKFISENKELIEKMKSQHKDNSKGLQKIAWYLSLETSKSNFFVSKTAFFYALKG